MRLNAKIQVKGEFFEGKAPEIVQSEMYDAVYEAVLFLVAKIKPLVPIGVYGAKGGLLSTISEEMHGKGTPHIKGIVTHGSKYGDVIEKGREPGKRWPPEGSLLRWIEVKFGVGETEAKSIEFLVRKKIGEKGFKGAHMFERAFNENFNRLDDIFSRRGFRIAKELSK